MSTLTKKPKSKTKKTAEGFTIIKTGPGLMNWRKERGVSRKLFSQMANCSERKMATYEKEAILPDKIKRPVTETMRLIKALGELAGDPKGLKEWLEQPNRAFDGRTPISLIRNGESDVIWEMVYQLRQGTFE